MGAGAVRQLIVCKLQHADRTELIPAGLQDSETLSQSVLGPVVLSLVMTCHSARALASLAMAQLRLHVLAPAGCLGGPARTDCTPAFCWLIDLTSFCSFTPF